MQMTRVPALAGLDKTAMSICNSTLLLFVLDEYR